MKKHNFLMLVFAALTAAPSFGAGDLKEPADPSVTSSAGDAGNELLTLKRCFELALQRSENLELKQEDLKQAEALYDQAIGSIRPSVHWQVSDLIQDTSHLGDLGGVSSQFIPHTQIQSVIVVRQPIFSGFREFAAMKGYKAEERRQKLLYKQASLDLYSNVAQVFYLVVTNETTLQDLTMLLGLTKDRVGELKGRVNLGKSRQSEVLSADSQYDSLRAQIESTKGQIAAARDLLSFFIGRDATGVQIVDDLPVVTDAGTKDAALARAENRTDVQAAREGVETRRFAAKASRANYWPSLGAVGDYYTKRTGFEHNVDWDVTLNLDVPLYEGGTASAQVTQLLSQQRQSELSLAQLERQIQSDVRRAHAFLVSSISQASILQTAYEKARRSYDLQVKEYRLGLVNNLDVLQAMNAMEQVKQNYDGSIIQGKLNLIALQVATEDIH